MTATLSPHLRVDSGMKIWHASGPLVHVHNVEEPYQASWRPAPVDQAPLFGQTIPPAPQPSPSVLAAALTFKPAAAKPTGADCPPGARGLATLSIFKCEDEGGALRVPTGSGTLSGSATPPRGYNGVKSETVADPAVTFIPHIPGADQLDPIAKAWNVNKKVSVIVLDLSLGRH